MDLQTADAQIFEDFESYDFESDHVFQEGLRSILSKELPDCSDSTSVEYHNIVTRAKWFYYSQTQQRFDLDAYLRWQGAVPSSTSPSGNVGTVACATPASSHKHTNDSMPHEPELRSLTFSEVVQKILNGEKIEGIRDIPDRVSSSEPSGPIITPPPKPWER